MAEPRGSVTRVEVAGRRLRLTSLEKVLYPATETTKGEVLDYYARVGASILTHLAGRPVTRVRWPHGVGSPSFFEKNVPPGAPSWLPRVGLEAVTYPLVEDLAQLTYLINLNSLELHVPQWRIDEHGSPAPPDRLVLDLDPGAPAGLSECAHLALLLRERLRGLGLDLYPVTSGSKGMQLYAPLGGDLSSEAVRDLARELAREMTHAHPDLVLWKMTRTLRPGKVLIDWSQNTAAKTTICPYSMRGRDDPWVAAPRTWAEVEAGAQDPDLLRQLDIGEVLTRLEEHGDLLAPLLTG